MGDKECKLDYHGMAKTRINNIYHSIKRRCYSKSCNNYMNYGGRGIKMCDDWLGKYGFRNFCKWAYENGYDENAPRGQCTIDRIDVNGDYCPENCRWITNKEQCNNKRNNRYIEIDGEILTFKQWCEKYNISPGAVYGRMDKGMDFETALKTPKKKTCKDMTDEELKEYKRKRAEQSKKWVEENKEHVNAKRKEWIDKNIEKVRASKRKYEEKKKHERKIQKLDNMIRG